jgi:predicted aspartyl protease
MRDTFVPRDDALVRRRFLCLATLSALASCISFEPAWRRAVTARAPAVPCALPVRWEAGVPVVEATVDGRGPFRFVLDTGMSAVALDQTIADDLHLDAVPADIVFEAAEGSFTARRTVRLGELRVGPLVDREVVALVLDLEGLRQASGTGIDGLLPASMFAGGVLTFEPDCGAVTYGAGELPPANGGEILDVTGRDRPFVAAAVGGSPCRVLLDTGSTGFLQLPAARVTSLRLRSPPTVTGRSMTAAGVVELRKVRLDETIALGRHRIAAPIVDVSRSDRALAGMDLLRRFRTTFDFVNRRVRLERQDDAPISTPPVRGPGAGFLRQRGALIVAYVLEGSPACAAGLRVGDRIEKVDGQEPRGAAAPPWHGDDTANRAQVVLRVVRDGVRREITVPIATLLE